MKPLTATIAAAPLLVVTSVGGDLQVVGWERPEITARADSESLSLRLEDDHAVASSNSGLILYVPERTALHITRVGGDADIRAVSGSIEITHVGGDLQMRHIGQTRVASLGGDLSAQDCAGSFQAENVGGVVSLRQMRGAVQVTSQADFYLREAEGDITARVGADAALSLRPQPGQTIRVQAGGDILLRVPADVQATFSLQGGNEEAIRVDVPGLEVVSGSIHAFTAGQPGGDIHLKASGEVIVTSREEVWQPAADFSPWQRGAEPFVSPAENGFPNLQPASRRAMRAALRAQEQGQHVWERVEAAIRRAEERMRSAERRSAHLGISMIGWQGASPAESRFPAETMQAERLAILRMLQEKKISLEEADRLLAALEGSE